MSLPSTSRASLTTEGTRTGLTVDVWLLRVLVTLAALTSSWSGVRAGPSNAADLSIMAACAVGVVVVALRRGSLPSLKWWMVLPALVCALLVARDAIVFGQALTDSPGVQGIGSIPMFGRLVLATAAPALIVAVVSSVDRRWLPHLATWWLFGALASALFAVAQNNGYLPEMSFLRYTIGTTSNRYPGLSSHPNALAQSIVLALTFSAYRFLAKRRFGFIQLFITLILAVMAVSISGSRAGIVMLVFAGASLVLVLLVYRSQWYWVPPVMLLLLVVSTIVLPPALSSTRLGGNTGQSDMGRLSAIARGWDLFTSNPVWGSGLGSWYGELSPLILLASGGVILFVSYAVFFGGLFRSIWGARSDPIAASALMGTFVVLGFLFLNNGIFERFTYWPALIAVALANVSTSSAGKVAEPARSTSATSR